MDRRVEPARFPTPGPDCVHELNHARLVSAEAADQHFSESTQRPLMCARSRRRSLAVGRIMQDVKPAIRDLVRTVYIYVEVSENGPQPTQLDLPLPDPPYGRQGGQGRIDDITGKGLRTAVALSTASC